MSSVRGWPARACSVVDVHELAGGPFRTGGRCQETLSCQFDRVVDGFRPVTGDGTWATTAPWVRSLHANMPREALPRGIYDYDGAAIRFPRARSVKSSAAPSMSSLAASTRRSRASRTSQRSGMEGDVIITQDLFLYDILGEDAKPRGVLRAASGFCSSGTADGDRFCTASISASARAKRWASSASPARANRRSPGPCSVWSSWSPGRSCSTAPTLPRSTSTKESRTRARRRPSRTRRVAQPAHTIGRTSIEPILLHGLADSQQSARAMVHGVLDRVGLAAPARSTAIRSSFSGGSAPARRHRAFGRPQA